MIDLIMQNSGGIQSPHDERDFKLEIIAGASLPETLPEQVMIDISQLPVWHQRKIGACVGHAWAKSQQKCELVETSKVIPLSARFLYAIAKCKDGYNGEGTYPRLVGQILKDYGCATEATCPNDTTLDHETYVFNRDISKIPYSALLEAPKYGIAGYAFSNITEQGLKQAIYYAQSKNQGIVMLLRVGDSFWTDVNGNVTWDKNKILPLRAPNAVTSGHEVYPCGYEYINGRLAIHFLNSWSKDWGDNGTGWFYFDEWKDYITEVMTSIDKVDVPTNTFTKNLSLGMSDPQIKLLQQFLNIHGFTVAQTGAGSKGNETNFFGQLTFNAVKKFQTANNIPNTGFVGVLTRQALNSQFK